MTPHRRRQAWVVWLWAAPVSALGGALGLAARRTRWQVSDGVVEVHGPGTPHGLVWRLFHRLDIEALTLGHVVLARSAQDLQRWRAHEHTHVRQFERWGPVMLLAYPASSLWQRACGRCAYRMNRFERAAFAVCDPLGQRPGPGQAADEISDSMP